MGICLAWEGDGCLHPFDASSRGHPKALRQELEGLAVRKWVRSSELEGSEVGR